MSRKVLVGFLGGTTAFIAAYQYGNYKPVLRASVLPTAPRTKWDDNWDRRSYKSDAVQNAADESHKKEKPTATRHLFLIRHGQYNIEAESDLEKWLTPLGREQAELTGKRLKVLNYPINRIVISTMTRAQETGNLISKNFPEVPVEHCDLLREGAPIPPEPPIHSWRPESKFFQDGARIEAAFRKYFHRADVEQKENSYELLVCHANVIRYFVCRALQLPPEAWLRISLHHGSITWLAIRPNGRVSLRMLGECGFMQPVQLSTT